MPARESEFRNLVLNQRVESSSPFIGPDVWKSCGGEPRDLRGCSVYAGLDLSATRDLTALIIVGLDPLTGIWSVKPIFWLPEEGIVERSQADRVPYDLWGRAGYIELVPGRSISYEYVAGRLRELFAEYDVRCVAFDKWGFPHLRPWLEKAGFSETMIKERFLEFPQGFKSMSPALRDLEAAILDRKVRHSDHPVLSMCAANAVIVSDPAGNRKLDKNKSSGRIDGMIGLVMALAAAPQGQTVVKFDARALIG
jgi:phage terminase large subunit-like protein